MSRDQQLQQLIDRAEIHDVLARYSRAVDRGDWELLRSVYHADAHDDHVDYRGDVPGLVRWLEDRFAGADNSTHFLGNCLIEFAGPHLALVETYFVSMRLRVPTEDERRGLQPADAISRQSWGRYVDRFERRGDRWGIAHRRVVLDARFTAAARGGARDDGRFWGTRDLTDPLYAVQSDVFDDKNI